MGKLNGSSLRRSDWALLLEVYIERHRERPFAWGTHDCATFAAGWIELAREDLTPTEDLARRFDYHTARGALDALEHDSLLEAVEQWGELSRIQPAFAQRGDLLLLDVGGRASLGLCAGDVACGPGSVGLEFVPMTAATAAWRV